MHWQIKTQEAREFAQQLYDRLSYCSLETLHAMKRDMRCENGSCDSRCGSHLESVVAHLVGVHPCTIYRWRHKQWLRPLRQPRRCDATPAAAAVGAADASVDAGNEEEIGARTTLPVLPTETTIARATHPNYKVGITLASLATLWAVEGLSLIHI